MQTGNRKSWLHAAGLLATTLIALALVGAALRGSWHDHRKAQLDQMSALARAFASHVGGVLNGVADDLRLITGEIAADPALLSEDDASLARRLALMRASRVRSATYAVFVRDGLVTPRVTALGEIADREAMFLAHAASAPGDLQVTPARLRAGSEDPGIMLSTSVRGADGRVLAVAAAHLEAADLMALFGDLGVLGGMRVNLLRVGGALLARMPAGSVGPTSALGHLQLRDLALGGAREGSTVEVSPLDGDRIVSTFVALPGLPIIPVVTVPEEEIWSSWLGANLVPLGIYTLLVAALLAVQAALVARLRRHERADEEERSLATREAEAAQLGLAVNDARFRDAIESIGEGFVLWDADDRLLLWNRRFVELTGIGEDVHRILRPGMKFDEAVRALGRRSLPAGSPDALEGWVLERMQRRVQIGVPWSFTSLNGRRLELEERRTSEGGLVSIYRDVDNHVSALQRLAEADARFRDGVESMGDGFLLLDRDDRIVTWNRRYIEMMPYMEGIMRQGATWSEMLDRALERGVPELDAAQRAIWIADRLAARARGDAVEFETRLGRTMQAVDRPTSEGGYVIIVRDITEEKRLLRKANDSEARFRDGIESMAEGFVMYDAQDRMVLWNQRARDMLTCIAEQWAVGIDFATLMNQAAPVILPNGSDAERERWVAARLAAHGARTPVEFTMPDGRMIEARDRPMSDGGTITIYRDVSEERRLMRRLAESEARFWDGIDSMGEGFLLCDPQDRIHAWNHQAIVLMPEMQTVVAVGKPFADFTRDLLRILHPDLDAAEIEARFAERMRWRGELGVARDVQWPSGRILRTTENRTSEGGIVSIWHDATAQLTARAELERALTAEREMNAQQRRFVSIASHEFRTPLAVIDGATQRLMARLAGADLEARKRLDRIRGAVSRMTELIERTLSSARLDEGRIELQAKPFDLAALLREVTERQRQISPVFDFACSGFDTELAMEGDARLLEQVFANLLSNAVKYSGRSRRIDIAVHGAGPNVQVAVADHGLGIPADEMSQLFTRFFRARTSMGIPGTGIGLHLVRELVQMHGGRVEVASEIGKGSTFTVVLPRRQPAKVPARNAAE